MDSEDWKIIENFENYIVSNTGKVKRITSGKNTYINKELFQSTNNAGYKTVILYKDKSFCRSVHKLVAEAFLEKPEDYDLIKYEIDHIDGDKSNNNVDNLQYLTHKENMNKILNHKSKYQTGKVILQWPNGTTSEYKNVKRASEELNINYITMCNSIRKGLVNVPVKITKIEKGE